MNTENGEGCNFRRSNFCKDHRDKIEVPDPLVVEDLISDKLNNRRKLARLIKLYCFIILANFRLLFIVSCSIAFSKVEETLYKSRENVQMKAVER